MSRARRLVATHGLDLVVAVVAMEAAWTTSTRDDLVQRGGAVRVFEVVGATCVVLTLLGRRRWPFVAPATTFVAGAALSLLDGRLIANEAGILVAGMGAAVLLGNQRRVHQSLLGLGIVVVGASVVTLNEPGSEPVDAASIAALFGTGWIVGHALRVGTRRTEAAEERARRAEREREAAARIAVAEERGRIARELHDVVAHAVSVIVLQVGAVRHRLPEGAAADREALRTVEEVGRTALTEMRRLLGAMRDAGEEAALTPHPGLDALDRLADEVRATGLGVHLEVLGRPTPLPRGLDLSAYRILQEGLTNSLRHSGAGTADVTVEYGPTALRLEVRDDGRRSTSGGPAGTALVNGGGHGLVGIRERVKLFGGDMVAGPAPGGGFVLRATLPLTTDTR